MLNGFNKISFLGFNILVIFCCFFISACDKTSEKAPPLPASMTWLNRGANFPHPIFTQKPTVLEFITDQCEACLLFLPTLKAMHQKYGDQINLLGIYSSSPERVLTPLEASDVIGKMGVTYPVLYDQDAKLFHAYEISGWPVMVLINTQGKIVKRLYGLKTSKDLDDIIQKTLAGEKKQ